MLYPSLQVIIVQLTWPHQVRPLSFPITAGAINKPPFAWSSTRHASWSPFLWLHSPSMIMQKRLFLLKNIHSLVKCGSHTPPCPSPSSSAGTTANGSACSPSVSPFSSSSNSDFARWRRNSKPSASRSSTVLPGFTRQAWQMTTTTREQETIHKGT